MDTSDNFPRGPWARDPWAGVLAIVLSALGVSCGGAVHAPGGPDDASVFDTRAADSTSDTDAAAMSDASSDVDAAATVDATLREAGTDGGVDGDAAIDAMAAADGEDAAAPDFPDASPPPWLGPSSFAACAAGPNVIYASSGPGSGVMDGAMSVSGTEAQWNAPLISGTILQLTVSPPGGQPGWILVLGSYDVGLKPGHYTTTSGNNATLLSLLASGAPCAAPGGSFDIYAIESTGSDQGRVLALQATFELTCDADGGGTPILGCVNYVAPPTTPPPGAVTDDPASPCRNGPRDSFYFRLVQDGGTLFEEVATNLDSSWQVSRSDPASLSVDLEFGDGRLDFEATTPDPSPLTVAAYGPDAASPGAPPMVSVILNGDESCRAPASRFSLDELDDDDAGHVTSLLVSYDCETGQAGFVGCVRFRY